MKFNRFLLHTVIAPVSVLSLVACSSSDDDDGDAPVETEVPVDAEVPVEEPPVATDVLLFDEADGGDITNDPNNPEFLQFIVGQNRINAAVVDPDLDYITVNVPAGSQLTAVEVTGYVSADDRSFIAIQAGSVFTVLPENAQTEIGNLLGYSHFGVDDIGFDVLARMGTGQGSQEFTPPLEAGDYTFWMQETGAEPVDFSLNFVVEASN